MYKENNIMKMKLTDCHYIGDKDQNDHNKVKMLIKLTLHFTHI